MQHYLIILTFTILQFFPNQEKSLEGRYIMQFEKKYKDQNCVIKFDKHSYVRKLTDKRKVSGTIDYQNLLIILKDNETPLEMIAIKSTIMKDTIKFRTVDTNNKIGTDGDIMLHEGMLIKIK